MSVLPLDLSRAFAYSCCTMDFDVLEDERYAAPLCALINRAYRNTDGVGRWTTEHHLVDGDRIAIADVKRLLADDSVTLLAGFAHAEPVCCIAVRHSVDKVELGTFAVEPHLQGQGIGKNLLHYAEQFSRHLGKRFEVTVVSANFDLIEFYIKRGYQVSGETRPYPVEANVGRPKRPLDLTVLIKPTPPLRNTSQ